MADDEATSKDVNVVEKASVDDEPQSSEISAPSPTKMTPRRFMALLSLVWLITTSATPILFISGTLCMPPCFLLIFLF